MTEEDDFSDLDVLMSEDPLKLSQQDLERIIAIQRKKRALREAGVKTKKPKDTSAPKLNIDALLKKPAVSSSSFKRRA